LYGFGDSETAADGTRGRVITNYAVVSLRPTAPRFKLRYWVRGPEARHVRVWQNHRLVVDELLPAGEVVEHVLDTPSGHAGMLLEVESEPPGVVVTGDFVER
jgi:hypothetical protein